MKKLGIVIILVGLMVLLRPQTASNQAPSGCSELLINGDMEANNGWVFHSPDASAAYSTDQFLSPQRSARLGIVEGPATYGVSSMRQDVAVPPGSHLFLQWHMWPRSNPFDAEDLQYVWILQPPYLTHLRTLWDGVRNDQAWLTCSYDLSDFTDQEITLDFSVRNSDRGGVTAMYVDDVSLLICDSPQPVIEGCLLSTPTPTPTATASPTPTLTPSPTASLTPTPTLTPSPTFTPTPTTTPTVALTPTATATPAQRCSQLIRNPDFTAGANGYDGWAQNLILSTDYRDATGEQHHAAWFGGATWSDQYLYQDVLLPPADQLSLDLLWATDAATDTVLAADEALTITLRGTDDSVLALLAVIDNNSPRQQWQTLQADLGAYAAMSTRLHFQSRTSENAVAWYVTAVHIEACGFQSLYLPLIQSTSPKGK